MAATMTAEDEKAAAELLKTLAGAKMRSLAPKVAALALEVVNSEDPELQAKEDAPMQAAMEGVVNGSKK